MVDRPYPRRYVGLVNAAIDAAKEANVKATYGFRATMKARAGKGDELVALLVTGQALYQDDVPVGGKLNAGAMQ